MHCVRRNLKGRGPPHPSHSTPSTYTGGARRGTFCTARPCGGRPPWSPSRCPLLEAQATHWPGAARRFRPWAALAGVDVSLLLCPRYTPVRVVMLWGSLTLATRLSANLIDRFVFGLCDSSCPERHALVAALLIDRPTRRAAPQQRLGCVDRCAPIVSRPLFCRTRRPLPHTTRPAFEQRRLQVLGPRDPCALESPMLAAMWLLARPPLGATTHDRRLGMGSPGSKIDLLGDCAEGPFGRRPPHEEPSGKEHKNQRPATRHPDGTARAANNGPRSGPPAPGGSRQTPRFRYLERLKLITRQAFFAADPRV